MNPHVIDDYIDDDGLRHIAYESSIRHLNKLGLSSERKLHHRQNADASGGGAYYGQFTVLEQISRDREKESKTNPIGVFSYSCQPYCNHGEVDVDFLNDARKKFYHRARLNKKLFTSQNESAKHSRKTLVGEDKETPRTISKSKEEKKQDYNQNMERYLRSLHVNEELADPTFKSDSTNTHRLFPAPPQKQQQHPKNKFTKKKNKTTENKNDKGSRKGKQSEQQKTTRQRMHNRKKNKPDAEMKQILPKLCVRQQDAIFSRFHLDSSNEMKTRLRSGQAFRTAFEEAIDVRQQILEANLAKKSKNQKKGAQSNEGTSNGRRIFLGDTDMGNNEDEIPSDDLFLLSDILQLRFYNTAGSSGSNTPRSGMDGFVPLRKNTSRPALLSRKSFRSQTSHQPFQNSHGFNLNEIYLGPSGKAAAAYIEKLEKEKEEKERRLQEAKVQQLRRIERRGKQKIRRPRRQSIAHSLVLHNTEKKRNNNRSGKRNDDTDDTISRRVSPRILAYGFSDHTANKLKRWRKEFNECKDRNKNQMKDILAKRSLDKAIATTQISDDIFNKVAQKSFGSVDKKLHVPPSYSVCGVTHTSKNTTWESGIRQKDGRRSPRKSTNLNREDSQFAKHSTNANKKGFDSTVMEGFESPRSIWPTPPDQRLEKKPERRGKERQREKAKLFYRKLLIFAISAGNGSISLGCQEILRFIKQQLELGDKINDELIFKIGRYYSSEVLAKSDESDALMDCIQSLQKKK
eukprot:g1361.t1